MPEMFGDLMATFFASLMPIILCVWALSYYIFVREINRAYQPNFNDMHHCEDDNDFANCDGNSTTISLNSLDDDPEGDKLTPNDKSVDYS